MPKKQLVAETLIDLHRRLSTLAIRSHERRMIMQETANLYGVSVYPNRVSIEHSAKGASKGVAALRSWLRRRILKSPLSPKFIGLKRSIEVIRDSGGMLSVVLAGHPKLKNDLRRSSMEEIGSRATIFELEGLGNEKRKYLKWLLAQSVAPKTKIESVVTDDAVAMLSEKRRAG